MVKEKNIILAVSSVSLLALLILGFNFNNYAIVGAIWSALYASIYRENKSKSSLVAFIVSFIILAIGILGLIME